MVWQRIIRRLKSGSHPSSKARSTSNIASKNRRRRLLAMETLTQRELMASDLGAVSGIAFTDNNSNGTLEVYRHPIERRAGSDF